MSLVKHAIVSPMVEKKKARPEQSRRVFVGMSGGVDSSVSAALLKEQGHEVAGVFIKVWQADFLPCTWREERRDAMRAAAHLDIPFLTLDLEKEYKKEVVDYMIREYGAGRVPNPDVMCNKYVKFGAFLDFAKTHGADFIATGHYARIQFPVSSRQFPVNSGKRGVSSDWQLATGNYKLLAGADQEKDQSYFLWTLTQEQLAHTLFPVGHLQKSEVRALATKYGLPNAEKKDSQGLCFMGKVDMTEFLQHYLKTQKGDVLDVDGTVIGTHEGAILYTIGQRHGFSVKKISANEEPYFVVAKDLGRNTITVSHRDAVRGGRHPTSSRSHLAKPRRDLRVSAASYTFLKETNVISGKLHSKNSIDCSVRTRYRGALTEATWETLSQHTARVTLANSQEGVAQGQSLVAYDGEECLGGGVISDTQKRRIRPSTPLT